MQITVEHNSVDISEYVISYLRESKICTGIATLEMELAYTYATVILPWDAISIIEGGGRVATFYVGQVTDSQPGAVITINAQDNSKRLTDYFITENYTVERKSHAKKWITKFLDDAGVDWKYTVSGNGGILTNNTTMGMQSAYDQIMTLLQLSGWYIRFDEYGKAFIGELSAVPPDFSTGSYANFPSYGIFTGTGNLPGYGDFPCSGTFIGLGFITGHEVIPQAGIFLLDSTFTGEGDIVGSGTFPCAGIFNGNGLYLGSGTFPGDGTFTGNGNFTDPGVYPGYSGISVSGIFTCYGTYPKIGIRLDNDVILDIKIDRNDRMYRNRVVVWGNGDSDTGDWVFADVRLIGNKWDYDANDRRTIVIANSNIPDTGDAFELANKALMEFGRLTVEKRITAAGALPIKVGDIVLVVNDLFTGNGMVTSFGVSMSKAGLISNIVLDERCPRLFGYYHPRMNDPFIPPVIPSGTLGYSVYVSTFGDGVWRKTNSGITESGWAGSMWEDYSFGLDELEITDLHINNGVLLNVSSSGDSYYSLESDGNWNKLNLNTLSVTASGIPETYSGLMSRACIIDKSSNLLKVVVDNRSGINYGDFLIETNPLSPINPLLYSGYFDSGTPMRSWVVDANPYDGSINNSYPVNYSGNYNFFVFDIDNDSTHDFVEAMTIYSGYISGKDLTPYGIHLGASWSNWSVHSSLMPTYMPYSGYPPIRQPDESLSPYTYPVSRWGVGGVAFYDGLPTNDFYGDGEVNVVAMAAYADAQYNLGSGETDLYLTLWMLYYDIYSGDLDHIMRTISSLSYPEITVAARSIVHIERVSDYTFNFYAANVDSALPPDTGYVIKTTVDFKNDIVTVTTLVDDLVVGDGPIVIDGVLYYYKIITTVEYGFSIYLYWVDLATGTAGNRLIKQCVGNFNPDIVGIYTGFFVDLVALFQDKYHNIRLIIIYSKNYEETFLVVPPWPLSPYLDWRSHFLTFNRVTYDKVMDTFNDDVILDAVATFGELSTINVIDGMNGSFNPYKQYAYYNIGYGDVGDPTWYTVFDSFGDFIITPGYVDSSLYDTIYNINGETEDAIVKLNDDSFSYINPDTGDLLSAIIGGTVEVNGLPEVVELKNYLGVCDTFNHEHFFTAYIDYGRDIVTINKLTGVTRRKRSPHPSATWTTQIRRTGNFSIVGPTVYYDRKLVYTAPIGFPFYYPIYILFAREGDNYFPVKSGVYRERFEISNYSPIITMDRRVSSLESRLITMDGQVQLSTHPAMMGYNIPNSSSDISVFNAGIISDDFKYADFSRVVESGLSKEILVIYNGGVGSIDAVNLTAFSGLYTTYSGIATRIETTNYQLPDQYIFLSVSGGAGDMTFFQRDPSGGVWVDYSSGYPQSRTTSIRIDDRI